MQAFPTRVILKIGTVRHDGTLPFAADAFVTISRAWRDANLGGNLFGISRPLRAPNDNKASCKNRQGPN